MSFHHQEVLTMLYPWLGHDTLESTLLPLYVFINLCLPILTFGLEVWAPELLLMERPAKNPSHKSGAPYLYSDGWDPSIARYHVYRYNKQLSFVRSTLALPQSATARRLMLLRSQSPSSSIVKSFSTALENLCLPDLHSLALDLPPKPAWKVLLKIILYKQF